MADVQGFIELTTDCSLRDKVLLIKLTLINAHRCKQLIHKALNGWTNASYFLLRNDTTIERKLDPRATSPGETELARQNIFDAYRWWWAWCQTTDTESSEKRTSPNFWSQSEILMNKNMSNLCYSWPSWVPKWLISAFCWVTYVRAALNRLTVPKNDGNSVQPSATDGPWSRERHW